MPLYPTTYIAGDEVNLRLTDDYCASENRSLTFTSESFPSLTSKTIKIHIDGKTNFVKQMVVENSKKIKVDLTSQELATIGAGRWDYELISYTSSNHIQTVVVGNLVITPEFGD